MIIQCDHCDTRFRMADEKIRPEGVKVRCAKCKQIFLALPPAPPEPVTAAGPSAPDPTAPGEEGADFDAPAGAQATPAESDFSRGTEKLPESGKTGDEISFADLGFAPPPATPPAEEQDFSLGDLDTAQERDEEQSADSDTGGEEDDGTFGDIDFGIPSYEDEDDFGDMTFDEDESAAGDEFTAAASLADTEEEDFAGFSFADDKAHKGQDEDSGFEFSPEGDDELLGASEGEAETVADDDFFGLESNAAEPSSASSPTEERAPGEDEAEFAASGFPAVDMEESKEAGGGFALESAEALDAPKSELPGGADSDATPAQPPRPRRSPVATLMVFFLGVLILLTAVTGYLFWKEGPQSFERLLQSLTGSQTVAPADQQGRIDLGQYKAGFTTNQDAGELFFINGQAINKYGDGRSAIQVKGVVLSPEGRPVMQQTVFCGNPLSEEDLKTLPYAKIEEAMNNQFGSSLSNLNLAPGAAIPFTIVFRNLPPEMAEFTVEVVDSRPASPAQ